MNDDANRHRAATEQEALDLLILRAAEDAERLRSERLHKVRRIVSKLDTDDELLDSIYESVCHNDHGAAPEARDLAGAMDRWRTGSCTPDQLADWFVAALPNYPTLYSFTDHPHWSDDQADAVVRVANTFRRQLQRKGGGVSRLLVRCGLQELDADPVRAKNATKKKK